MYTRYHDPEIFVHTFDGIDRTNHIVATYFLDDALPGEDFVDHFALIQSMVLEGSTGTWEKVEEDTEEVRQKLCGKMVGYFEIPGDDPSRRTATRMECSSVIPAPVVAAASSMLSGARIRSPNTVLASTSARIARLTSVSTRSPGTTLARGSFLFTVSPHEGAQSGPLPGHSSPALPQLGHGSESRSARGSPPGRSPGPETPLFLTSG